MQVDDSIVSDSESHYRISLCGQTIQCRSLDDAVAVKMAADILRGDDPTPYRHDQLEPIAEVLLQYGQRQAADTLLGRTGHA